jgi:carboxyl-terminal processing protease
VLPLSDNTGLAITTAFYYTPSGRSIQRPLSNSALSETFDIRRSKPTYKTDKGRVVTGGGGIIPDVSVFPPIPTRLEIALDGSGAFVSFATDYVAKHTPLPNPFVVTPDTLDEFKVFVAARDIQPNVSEWSGERSWISNRIQEEVVTQARGVEQGDEVEAQFDPQIQAALKSLRTGTMLAQR